MVDVAEDVGGVLVDRRLPRAGRRVGLGAGVDLQRVEARRACRPSCPPRRFARGGYASRGALATARRGARSLPAAADGLSLGHRTAPRRRSRCPTPRPSADPKPPTASRSIRATRRPSRVLTASEIDRLRALRRASGTIADGEALFVAGEPGAGHVRRAERARWRSRQRDGFGRRAAGGRAGARASSSPRSAQLSGRPALVDGHAEGAVETILIPPAGLRALLVAEADARRADHPGADPAAGAADPGRARRAADRRRAGRRRRAAARELPAPQRPCPTRSPTPTPTPPRPGLLSHCTAGAAGAAAGGHAHRRGAAQPVDRRARPRARPDRAARRAASSSTWRWSAPGRPGSRRRSMPPPRGCRWRCSTPQGYGGQAGASARIENYLGFPTGITGAGADRPRLRPGREVRRRDHLPGGGDRARLPRRRRPLPAGARPTAAR